MSNEKRYGYPEGEKEILEYIREMAQLTILTGRINDIQEKNLKMYPMIFFNGVKSIKMDYDLMHPKTSKIDYHLDLDSSEPNSNMDRRFEFLTNSVRNLLWNDISVTVHLDGKVIFSSKPHERREETNSNS